jgi:hypothetical protein
MLMRHPQGGLKVLINMSFGPGTDTDKFSYSSFPRKKPPGVMVGQIGFAGSSAGTVEGVRLWTIRAVDEVAQPLHQELERLSKSG